MKQSYRVVVTGNSEDLLSRLPNEQELGFQVTWEQLPLLSFEPLEVDPKILSQLSRGDFGWVVFPSERSVKFFSLQLIQAGMELPANTRVACMGEQTANVARLDGYDPDFIPAQTGTEGFLEEFRGVGTQHSGRLLIVGAEEGRRTLDSVLAEWGLSVERISVYRTLPAKDISTLVGRSKLEQADCLLFTSPSSVGAFVSVRAIPSHVKLACLGNYTAHYLQDLGFTPKILSGGSFENIGEILCSH